MMIGDDNIDFSDCDYNHDDFHVGDRVALLSCIQVLLDANTKNKGYVHRNRYRNDKYDIHRSEISENLRCAYLYSKMQFFTADKLTGFLAVAAKLEGFGRWQGHKPDMAF